LFQRVEQVCTSSKLREQLEQGTITEAMNALREIAQAGITARIGKALRRPQVWQGVIPSSSQ
jgi:hypothetical protein